MERLTKRIDGISHGAEGKSADDLSGKWCRGEFECTALIEKLAEYEDAEESGEFLKLPCGVYSYLFAPTGNTISIFQVVGFEYSKFDVFIKWKLIKGIAGNFRFDGIYAQKIGEKVFLTMEEAEKALKELEKNHERL